MSDHRPWRATLASASPLHLAALGVGLVIGAAGLVLLALVLLFPAPPVGAEEPPEVRPSQACFDSGFACDSETMKLAATDPARYGWLAEEVPEAPMLLPDDYVIPPPAEMGPDHVEAGGYRPGDPVATPHGTHEATAEIVEAVAEWMPEERQRWAIQIAACESAFDRTAVNPTGTYFGWFQHIRRQLLSRARAGGYTGNDPASAEAQVRATTYLLGVQGPNAWPTCNSYTHDNPGDAP